MSSNEISSGRYSHTYASIDAGIDIIAESDRLAGLKEAARQIRIGGAGSVTVEYRHPQGGANIVDTLSLTAAERLDGQIVKITGGTATGITVIW